jgi:UDP-2,3-diacylglucosamine hydrolase
MLLPPSSAPIGMLAGNGIYPETFVAGARKAGVQTLVAAAFLEETQPDLAQKVDSLEWFRVGQLGKMIAYFKRHDVKHCVMVGQIAPSNLFTFRPDFRILFMLARLKQRNAETLFGGIADELAKDGITLLPATTFLTDQLAHAGHIAGPALKKRRQEDVDYGFTIAKESSRLDIGQTVVVRGGTVLAVEAFEGTNECLKRGGSMGKGSATMVKVSKPKQDMRFDVPVLGPETIRTAAQSGVDVIAVEAGMTLILSRAEVESLCTSLKVSLVGVS